MHNEIIKRTAMHILHSTENTIWMHNSITHTHTHVNEETKTERRGGGGGGGGGGEEVKEIIKMTEDRWEQSEWKKNTVREKQWRKNKK